jgi:hypothetical protein
MNVRLTAEAANSCLFNCTPGAWFGQLTVVMAVKQTFNLSMENFARHVVLFYFFH